MCKIHVHVSPYQTYDNKITFVYNYLLSIESENPILINS